MSYSKLVSTIPLPSLIKCLDNVPEEVERAAGELKYNSLISIILGMSVPKTKDYSWVYFPGETGLFHRVSFPSNYSPEVAPEGNCSVLAEITCHQGDRIWNMSDAELVEDTVKGLDELEVIRKDDVVFSDLTRMTPAYVIYDVEYDRNIKIVKDFIRQQGIEICGRFGEFEYLNMDACIERAMSLADDIK